MTNGFISVPFKTESGHGLSEIDGMGKFSRAGIVLEFESKLFGIIKSGVKEVRIATDEILDVKFRKGFIKRFAKIELRLKDFAKLTKLPNSGGKITLKIKKDDFDRAREAVERLEKDMNERQEQLPPAHTPVSRLFTDDDSDDEETMELKNK